MKNQDYIYCTNQIQSLGPFQTFMPYKGSEQLDRAIQCFEETGIVGLTDTITSKEWNEFIDRTTRSGILIVQDKPSSWTIPTRISLVRYYPHLLEASPWAADYCRNHIQFKRKVENFSKRALCMVGDEYDRAHFVQYLYAFGFDEEVEIYHSRYQKTHSENNVFGVNLDLSPLVNKRLEPVFRWHYKKNLPVIENAIKDKDIEIVLPNRCLQDGNELTEKLLTSFVFGIPSLYVLQDGLKTLMKDYDFDVITPKGQDTLGSAMEWLGLFCRLTNDQRQRFQDDNAEKIIKNQQSLFKLPSRLLENFKEDFRRL